VNSTDLRDSLWLRQAPFGSLTGTQFGADNPELPSLATIELAGAGACLDTLSHRR